MRAGGWAPKTAAVLLLCATALSACTGDDDGGSDGGADTTAPPDEIVDGGTMRLGLGGPLLVDPVDANLASPSDLMVLDLLHDGLTRLDADGTPEAGVATSWRSNASLTAWRFTIDPDATFASGRAVTAADVIASLERVAKAGDTSLAALRLETVNGFRDFVAGTTEHLAGLTAPDPATVRVALDTPLSVLPTILASPVFGVVDVSSLGAAAADGDDLDDLDLSGDWQVGSADDDSIRLDRREGTDGHLDSVELRAYDDGEAAYDAFDDGDVDWALVPLERYGDAVQDHGDDDFAPFHAELFFGLNVRSPSLGNVELRKAIAAAIDRDAIVDAVYPDLADALRTVVPAGVPGHDPDRCPACAHDLERAKGIVGAAFPDGQVPLVRIDFDASPQQEAMARLVAADLGAAGIPTELRPQPLEDYKRFVVSGAQELFSFGWIGGYTSADAYLAPLFASTATDNLTGYGAAAVDASLGAARTNPDPASAAAQWAAAEAQVLADAVVVPIAQFRTQAVVAERAQAFQHAVDGSVDWSAVWLTDGR
jgi:ABC-type transport system substrate-binding protein